ncbi:MAG: single-stranded DNA-binding protein [Terrimesophilobacter sp.]
MNDTITLAGLVATPPHQRAMSGNHPVITFRLLSSQSHFDRVKGVWIDDDPNWYTVSAFRQLAVNVLESVTKGDRVIVVGRLRIHDWEASGRSGTSIDLNADSVGHDLCFGRTSYSRVAGSVASRSGGGEGSGASQQPPADSRVPVEDSFAAVEQEQGELLRAAEPGAAAEQSDELIVPF